MGILTKHELIELAKKSHFLGGNFLLQNFQASSYDLRIGTIFKNKKIYSQDFKRKRFTNNIEINPGEIVSILTLEHIEMPNDCVGTVFAMNKFSSSGLLILNPGHIDPGYSGPISICLINLSKDVQTLSLGQEIFTLLIDRLDRSIQDNDVYQNKPFTTRKEYEQNFLKERSKKLSNSIFDLVTDYDPAKELLTKKIFESIKWRYKIWIYIITSILSIYALFDIVSKGFNYFKQPINVKQDTTKNPSIDSFGIYKQYDSTVKKLNQPIKK